MGEVLFALPYFLLWLSASALVYWLLLSRLVRRSARISLHVLLAIGAGFFLSPGLVIGHGVVPFPAGPAILLSAGSSFALHLAYNGPWWLVTSVVFVTISLWYRPRTAKVYEAPRERHW